MRDKVDEYFTENANSWVEDGYVDDGYNFPVGKHRSRVVKNIINNTFPKGKFDILDVGCGGGNLLFDLVAQANTLIGIDQSQAMIDIAKEQLVHEDNGQYNKIKFHCQNVYDHTKNCEYDIVTAMGVIGYQEDSAAFLEKCAGLLKKGGLLILSSRNRLFNLFPISKYMSNEVSSGQAEKLLLELQNLDSQLSLNKQISFLENLKKNTEILLTTLKDDSHSIENDHCTNGRYTFGFEDGGQHTPLELKNIAENYNLNLRQTVGIHPHLMPTVLQKSLSQSVYNKLNGALTVFEDDPISLLWSSVFISVFEKA